MKQLGSTVQNGGTALVTCTSAGILYDLFELLSQSEALANFSRFYFISPIAKATLAYSNIYAEWLSSTKQAKAYQPEIPFPHGDVSPKPKRTKLEGQSANATLYCFAL